MGWKKVVMIIGAGALLLCGGGLNAAPNLSDSARAVLLQRMKGPALVQAAAQGELKRVDELLAKGADPNAHHPKTKITPLMASCLMGETNAVQLLIQQGANIEAVDAQGNRAIHHAARLGNTESLRLLLDHEAKVNAPGEAGYTALTLAAMNNHPAAIRLLLKRGAQADAQDTQGRTPLFWAAIYGNLEAAQILLNNGADPRLEDRGMRAADYARSAGHTALAELLENRSAP